MLKNYFITALRIFRRNKAFATINILGLSIGICAALVIFLIVQFEFSYDKAEPDSNRIYRVVMDLKFNGTVAHSAAVPAPLSSTIQTEVTGVEATVPVMQFQGDGTAKVLIERENASKPIIYKSQPDIVFTNAQYFSLLPFHWIAGTPKSSLQKPFNVVLTESRAKEYFPALPFEAIIGKQIIYNDDITATVSGIVEDLNAHTSFDAVEFISFATITETHLKNDFMMNVWNDWMAYSQIYIKLSKGTKTADAEHQLTALLIKYNKDANKDSANTMHFHLQPLGDVHFNSLYTGYGQRLAHKSTLYGLSAIALFLLLLACFNFINLTTANAAKRAKEIGIRKTMGSSKQQLVLQFLGETFILTAVSAMLPFFLATYLLRLFANFIPPGLRFQPLQHPWIFLFLVLLTLVASLFSGLYPALILSGSKTVQVLKTQSSVSGKETRHAWIRKSLIVSQFVIAQFFVIATLIVSKQINYSLHADMGFRKEAILTFRVPESDALPDHRNQLFNELKGIPGVQMVSRGFITPADTHAAFTEIKYVDGKNDQKQTVQLRWGDISYLQLFQIKLLAGRNVEQSDTIREFLINETFSQMLGFKHPEDAINKQLDFNGKKMPIIGVMHDFHEQSFHSVLGPVVFASFGNRSYFFHIALVPQNAEGTLWQSTIGKIKSVYHQIYPDDDFIYQFFDDTIKKFYENEERTASLLDWATGLAVLISCLGLLGLVIYTINTRTKEIGIRKILGATVPKIVAILLKDFLKLVFIAFIIAAPIAWWAGYKWLEDFAYRTPITWWVFILSGLGMLLIALTTLSIQAIKAAVANPVKSLRTE